MNMFYAEQPVDWLMIGFRQAMGQRQRLVRNPTLFQHFGVKSSFDTSRNNDLKDRFETLNINIIIVVIVVITIVDIVKYNRRVLRVRS